MKYILVKPPPKDLSIDLKVASPARAPPPNLPTLCIPCLEDAGSTNVFPVPGLESVLDSGEGGGVAPEAQHLALSLWTEEPAGWGSGLGGQQLHELCSLGPLLCQGLPFSFPATSGTSPAT